MEKPHVYHKAQYTENNIKIVDCEGGFPMLIIFHGVYLEERAS